MDHFPKVRDETVKLDHALSAQTAFAERVSRDRIFTKGKITVKTSRMVKTKIFPRLHKDDQPVIHGHLVLKEPELE